MNLTALGANILFQFVDPVNTKGQFEKGPTASGIILQGSFDDSAKTPRWATVKVVGPNCSHVTVGQQILLPALRWTEATKVEGQHIWKTDETQVVAVRDSSDASELKALGSFVVFTRNKPNQVSANAMGILVVGNVTDTTNGQVVAVGNAVDTNLTVGSKMYYDATNFFETFVHNGTELAFVTDDKIFCYEVAE